MTSPYSPINVVMLGGGGILVYSAWANRSPVNVVKAALGLEESKTLPPISAINIANPVTAVVDTVKEAPKKVVPEVAAKTPVVGSGGGGTATAPYTAGGSQGLFDLGGNIAKLFGLNKG